MEILAPAGTEEMLAAAIENGADAVYFGVQSFNARMRANNFSEAELPALMRRLHERGMKGYLTFNVLIFENELEQAKDLLLAASRSGVDAIIVQDLGLAWLARRLTPDLPVHASTQMTISSAESIAAIEMLGIDCERIVLARELSTDDIAKIAKASESQLEVFIHGALCVAYSGQCLTSEALGGRSANRGECAQACRLPYELIVDGEKRDLGEHRYLVSPKDLAGYQDVPRLLELGVSTLKIEGRLKSPEYVAATVQVYRDAVDAAKEQRAALPQKIVLEKLENTFSRGFTGGYLHENNHQAVVDGETSSKRGPFAGVVEDVTSQGVRIKSVTSVPLKPGDGVLLERADSKVGGRLYAVEVGERRGEVILRFGREQSDIRNIRKGDKVWKTSDPQVEKSLRQSFEGEKIRYRRPVDLAVFAAVGEPLRIVATDPVSGVVEVCDRAPVERAEKHPLTEELLVEQLGRLGGTPFRLGYLSLSSDGRGMVPMSRLNSLRRELVDRLVEARKAAGTRRTEHPEVFSERLAAVTKGRESPRSEISLSVLCRTIEQVEAAATLPLGTIYTDFEDQRLHMKARQLITRQRFCPASIRILKPGEDLMLRKILSASPDAILIRNLAAWQVLCVGGFTGEFIADYSLNISNSLSAGLLRDAGFSLITPSYDLNSLELRALLDSAPPAWFEVTMHQRIPMFHMEHCVFCRFLSEGRNSTDCGRPCESHSVTMRDRMGYEHPLKADYGCRNTLFNAVPQSGAEYLPELLASGVRSFRLDLLAESAEETIRLIELYQAACERRIEPNAVWKELRAASKLGVTRGSLDHGLTPMPRSGVVSRETRS